MSFLLNPYAFAAAAYTIGNSCRFNPADSANLEKTFTAGDRGQFVQSAWIKRSGLTAEGCIFGAGTTASILSQLGYRVDEDIRSYTYSGGSQWRVTSTAKYRDPSAWQHVVFSLDTASGVAAGDRCRLWVNGVEVTSLVEDVQPGSGNVTSLWNAGNKHWIGARPDNSAAPTDFLNGYLAEVVFLDSQSIQNDDVTITSFGEFDDNGNWVPIDVSSLTFGTNGFHLDFAVAPGTGNGAGTDVSGNDNHFTDSGLAANDQMKDSPTDDADNDVGNYAVLASNAPAKTSAATLSNGGTHHLGAGGGWSFPTATIGALTSGKWVFCTQPSTIYNGHCEPGISNETGIQVADMDSTTGNWRAALETSTKFELRTNGGSIFSVSHSPTMTTDDYLVLAFDIDNLKLWAGIWDDSEEDMNWYDSSGTIRSTDEPGLGTNESATLTGTEFYFWTGCYTGRQGDVDFGQIGLLDNIGSELPAGFKKIHTGNLPAPAITDPSKYFQSDTYTGTGSSLSRTLTDAEGGAVKPDFVWIKDRDSTSTSNILTDSVRGATKTLHSDAATAEFTSAQQLKSFDSSGYTVGTNAEVNNSSSLQVAWCWNTQGGAGSSNEDGSINTTSTSVGTTQGFSISKYTGTGSAATVGHGLGVAPDLIYTKNLTDADAWGVYHSSNTAAPETDYMVLNTTAVTADDATYWNDTAPTTSVFSIGTITNTNGSGDAMVAYCWAGVDGYSKFGGYTGNSNADGTFVWCGFRPAYVLVKRTDAVAAWTCWYKGGQVNGAPANCLELNGVADQITSSARDLDILSNGFKPRASDDAHNIGPFVFAAFAEFPFGGEGVSQARAR